MHCGHITGCIALHGSRCFPSANPGSAPCTVVPLPTHQNLQLLCPLTFYFLLNLMQMNTRIVTHTHTNSSSSRILLNDSSASTSSKDVAAAALAVLCIVAQPRLRGAGAAGQGWLGETDPAYRSAH